MARTKRKPQKVVDYNSLNDDLKKMYDNIAIAFNCKNIFLLREEARKMAVESPTTLSKDALVKRMTDRVLSDYIPGGNRDRDEFEPDDPQDGEEHIRGIFESYGMEYRIGYVTVPAALVREAGLRNGDLVEGMTARLGGKRTLIIINSVDGKPTGASRAWFSRMEAVERRPFDDIKDAAAEALTPGLFKGERVIMPEMTIKDSSALIGSFEYGMGLYVGLAPEEKGIIPNGSFAVGFDLPLEEETRIARLALERAKRLSERGMDAVLVVHGFGDLRNNDVKRAIFGAGRCFSSGSLTVIADIDLKEEGGSYKKVATRIAEKE